MVYCSFRKAAMGVPALLAYGLITYIAYVFQLEFLPERFADEWFSLLHIFIRVTFTYFSTMTYLHLTRCLLADPGYIPNFLKTPLKMPEKVAPLEKVRLYNMRLFEENNIYSFATLE